MIGAETRGQLRAWKRAAAARYAAYERVINGEELHDTAVQMVLRSSLKGRQRSLERLRRLLTAATFEGASLAGKHPVAIWSVLRPREAVTVDTDDPSLQQDCVVIEYLVLGVVPGFQTDGPLDEVAASKLRGKWSLEVPDHALHRLLERSRGTDIGAVLLAAHHTALRARHDDEKLLSAVGDPDRSFLLPAGNGVFVCGFIAGEDIQIGSSCHLFTRTWLHNDQLYDDQRPLLVETGTGARLGEGLLLPAPLRRLDAVGGQIEGWTPGIAALQRVIRPPVVR